MIGEPGDVALFYGVTWHCAMPNNQTTTAMPSPHYLQMGQTDGRHARHVAAIVHRRRKLISVNFWA
jgi:ectoine hydroxylase-related dioxygenase (phytanoyl-CoA dioxygenase family)